MAIHYRTRGFVLKKDDLQEADQVFTIFTKDFGKLKIIGKAIRKIKSKLRGGVEIFYLSEIEFIQGKNHKTLTDAIVIEKFKNIRNSPKKLKAVYQIAEILDELVAGQEKDEKIWDLLTEVFGKLNEGTEFLSTLRNSVPLSRELLYYYFLWNLLSILGYQIDLYNCANCQKKLQPEKLYFIPEEGTICGECLNEGEVISPDIIKILRLFLQKDWQTLSRLKIADSYEKSLEKISEDYLSYYQNYQKVG